MVNVSGNNHAAAGNFITDLLRRQLLFLSYVFHLLSDDTPASVVHLGKVAIRVFGFAMIDPY